VILRLAKKRQAGARSRRYRRSCDVWHDLGERVAARFEINLFFSCDLPGSAWYDFKMELLLLILGACFLGGLILVGLTALVVWLVMSSKDKGNRREEDGPRSDDQ
jgi:hypothetical protein